MSTQDLRNVFQKTATPVYLTQLYAAASGVPASGTLKMSDFAGRAKYNAGLMFRVVSGWFNNDVNYFTTATTTGRGVSSNFTNINTGTAGICAVNGANFYSVEWWGYFYAPETGNYTFTTVSDDASYLWIGDVARSGYTAANATVNNGGVHAINSRSSTIALTANTYYPIRFQFSEYDGNDDMQVCFTRPSAPSTNVYDMTGYVYNYVPSVLPVNGLVAWYDADSFALSGWANKTGDPTQNVPQASIGQAITKQATPAGWNYVAGGTGDAVTFPANQMVTNYTLFHVARYAPGGQRRRILEAWGTSSYNWLSGFWNYCAGTAFHGGWLTGTSTTGLDEHGYNWVMSSDQSAIYRSNGASRVTYPTNLSVPSPFTMGINRKGDELSAWNVAEIIIYNRQLEAYEITQVEAYLRTRYTGATLSTRGLYFRLVSGYFADNVNYFATATLTIAGYSSNFTNIWYGTAGYMTVNDPADTLYSVEWYGLFLAPETGTYTFYTNSDDASYLWIGDAARSGGYTAVNALISNGGGHSMREVAGTVDLAAATYYPIRIQFGAGGGYDDMQVSMLLPSGPLARIYDLASYVCHTIDVATVNTNGADLRNWPVKLILPYKPMYGSNFQDLRFYINGQLLNHWIESVVPSTSAVVWVLIPYLSYSTTIGVSVGNTATTGNGKSVFHLFDNFAGTTLDTGIWNTNGQPFTVNNSLTITGTGFTAIYTKQLSDQIALTTTAGTTYMGRNAAIEISFMSQSGGAIPELAMRASYYTSGPHAGIKGRMDCRGGATQGRGGILYDPFYYWQFLSNTDDVATPTNVVQTFRFQAVGNTFTNFLDGVQMSTSFTSTDFKYNQDGILAVLNHNGQPLTVYWVKAYPLPTNGQIVAATLL